MKPRASRSSETHVFSSREGNARTCAADEIARTKTISGKRITFARKSDPAVPARQPRGGLIEILIDLRDLRPARGTLSVRTPRRAPRGAAPARRRRNRVFVGPTHDRRCRTASNDVGANCLLRYTRTRFNGVNATVVTVGRAIEPTISRFFRRSPRRRTFTSRVLLRLLRACRESLVENRTASRTHITFLGKPIRRSTESFVRSRSDGRRHDDTRLWP